MATGAVCRKLSRFVIRIRRLVEISQVTAYTSVGRIVVIAVVAAGTVIGNGCMCAIKGVVIVVHPKSSRCPAGGCGVATCAIVTEPKDHVIGICGLIEILGMAGGTSSRCALEACTVAIETVDTYVCSRQREGSSVVVKNQVSIPGWVAGQTGIVLVYIPAYIFMRFIRFRIQVTTHTGKFCIVGRVGMAVRALTPLTFMRPAVNGEILGVVVKGGRHPGRFAMATGTISRKLRGYVVGVASIVVVCQVAAYTGVGRIVVIAVVTGSTIIGNGRMRAIERIVVVVVGKRCRRPAGLGGVATGTVIAKAQGYVVGVAGLVEVRCMAARTGVGGIGVIPVVTSRAVIGD